jgi:hypothetical protein
MTGSSAAQGKEERNVAERWRSSQCALSIETEAGDNALRTGSRRSQQRARIDEAEERRDGLGSGGYVADQSSFEPRRSRHVDPQPLQPTAVDGSPVVTASHSATKMDCMRDSRRRDRVRQARTSTGAQ